MNFQCQKYGTTSIWIKKKNIPKIPEASLVLHSDLMSFCSYMNFFFVFAFKIN